MTKEQECIEKSLAVKIASTKARLAKLHEDGIPFEGENPLSGLIEGIRGGIAWEEKTNGKIKQILILPLLIPAILFMMILTPLIYISHRWDVLKKKQELKKEIRELNNARINKNYSALQYDYQREKKFQKTLSFWGGKLNKNIFTSNIPKDNTLWSLWRLYGLDKDTFSSDERISLVRDWLDTLYGKEVTIKLNIEKKIRETMELHAKANEPYFQRKVGAAHFYFMNPVDSVIRNLSKELPSYG
ncbi:MAG: hypothetical protein WBN66_09235 [Smithella sp.]